MAQTAAASIPVGRVALGALFVGFLKVSLLGIGGGPVWARRIAVDQKCWVTDREFADCFAVSQVVPGPNIILMMGLVGLKVGGIPGAVAAALATFGPPCLMYYSAYRLRDLFRDAPWERIVSLGLAPSTIGLVHCWRLRNGPSRGFRLAQRTGHDCRKVSVLTTRINPLWILHWRRLGWPRPPVMPIH
jgi:chromate transporter